MLLKKKEQCCTYVVPKIKKPRQKSRLSLAVLEAGIEPALRRTGF